MSYDVVIGLEVHAQLLTATKIFASSSAKINESPNAHIDPVTLGMPCLLYTSPSPRDRG